MTAPTKPLSLWTRVYGLFKYLSTFSASNKHATEPSLEDECLNKIECEPFQCLPSISRNTYDQVFITDNDEMYQWASKDTYMFTTFKFLQRLKCLWFVLDGMPTINSCWKSVLKLDEVLNKEPLEITDTLILHCESIEAYSKVIPRIHGSYNRLILHGHTTWHQIKQLYHPGVQQYRINATFEITTDEHDEFVNFVKEHCRGWRYKFSIAYETKCPLDLLKKLYKTFCSKSHPMQIGDLSYDCISFNRFYLCAFFCHIFPVIPTYIVYSMLHYLTNIDKPGVDISGALAMIVFAVSLIAVFYMRLASPVDTKINVKDKDYCNTVKYIRGK